jgi:hypothetical protein
MFRACRSKSDPAGFECIFVETATKFKHNKHTFIECIPVPLHFMGDLPMYFRKAIQEEGEEWATNPKLVTTFGKRLHNCIPKDFPYFHIEWNRDREGSNDVAPSRQDAGGGPSLPQALGGFCHVIEDEHKFPRNFARQVLGGMMQMDRLMLKMKFEKEPVEKQKQKVAKFKALFKNFDWTALPTE